MAVVMAVVMVWGRVWGRSAGWPGDVVRFLTTRCSSWNRLYCRRAARRPPRRPAPRHCVYRGVKRSSIVHEPRAFEQPTITNPPVQGSHQLRIGWAPTAGDRAPVRIRISIPTHSSSLSMLGGRSMPLYMLRPWSTSMPAFCLRPPRPP